MTESKANYIAGSWVAGGNTIDNVNPSDLSDVIGAYAQADAAQSADAIAAARAAVPAWAATGPERRYKTLMAIGEELTVRAAELGELLSREEGKPRAEGVGEVYRSGQFFTYYAAEALRLADEERDLEGALALMAASEAIDPNAFPALHAELERRAGRLDAALLQYERATFVDPFDARAWLRRAEVLQELGRRDEARAVLRSGLARLSENLLLFRPEPDPNVDPRYNAKAAQSYADLQRGVAALRAADLGAPLQLQ